MTTQLDATLRTESGKGAARRARAAGGVPAIVYGTGKTTASIVVNPKQLHKALMGPRRRNEVITLNMKDAAGKAAGNRTVVVRDLQADPVKRHAIHVDFLEIDPTVPLAMKVPIEVVGKSKAFADGGKMTLIVRTVTLSVVPTLVPEKVIFDVSAEGFGVVRAKQMKAPEGTTVLDHPETPLVSIRIPRGDKEEEAAAAATPAEGAAAAAPAAGAKGAATAAAAAPAAAAKPGDKKK